MEWMMMEFDDLFNYWCGVLVLLIIIIIAIYARYHSHEDTNTDWKLIGHIKRIYIYPIEGGYRKEVNQVNCSEKGLLTSYDSCNNILWKDRKYLIYSEPREELRERKQPKDEEKLGVINVHNANFVTLKTDILGKIQETAYTMIEYPDGTTAGVLDCGDQIASTLSNYCGKKQKFRMADQNRISRRFVWNSKNRRKNNENYSYLNPEFSIYSLVNDESVEDVRVKTKIDNLTHLNFRPNFVIKAEKYCEDEVEYLKIGSAVFCNAKPCTIDDYVNIDPESGTSSESSQPYLYLSEKRQLKDMRPDISTTSNKPIFGINLDLSSDGKISVGDKVYARNRDPLKSSKFHAT